MNRTQPIAVGAYSFPERALRRWARENLSVVPRADGGVDAVFRFEGSTDRTHTLGPLLMRV